MNAPLENGNIPSDEISLAELLKVVWDGRKLIALITSAFTVTGVIYALLATPIYQAETVIMPPQQQQSAAASMLSALGGITGGGGGGIGAALGLKNPNDIYVAMLKSKAVGDGLIQQFNLMAIYEAEFKTNALKTLAAQSKITAGKDGLISIQVENKDPKLAADIANAYVEQLKLTMSTLAVSSAAQKRLFFEKQLELSKNKLAQAEVELAQVQQKTGIIQLEAQGAASIQASTTLQAEIASKEAQLAGMRNSLAPNHPELKTQEQAVQGLKQQLAQMSKSQNSDGLLLSKGKMTDGGMDYVRKLREVKYQQTLFEMLAKQYEMARLDEANEGAVIQVLDRAEVPELKSKPKRSMYVIGFSTIGVLLAIFYVIIQINFQHFIRLFKKA